MEQQDTRLNRRSFLQKSALVTAGALGTGTLFAFPTAATEPLAFSSQESDINIFGPKEGYTPQIGTLVSMLNWMRMVILAPVRGMSAKDLDYVHDENANSIGAMLMHLAATERFYQIHTLEGKNWGDWSKKDSDRWSVASGLGANARKQIKGNELSFYLDALEEVRAHTLAEFAKRDDEWLLAVDKDWPWGPTNNYCKWFHVCEHESNHNGQFKWIKSRIS